MHNDYIFRSGDDFPLLREQAEEFEDRAAEINNSSVIGALGIMEARDTCDSGHQEADLKNLPQLCQLTTIYCGNCDEALIWGAGIIVPCRGCQQRRCYLCDHRSTPCYNCCGTNMETVTSVMQKGPDEKEDNGPDLKIENPSRSKRRSPSRSRERQGRSPSRPRGISKRKTPMPKETERYFNRARKPAPYFSGPKYGSRQPSGNRISPAGHQQWKNRQIKRQNKRGQQEQYPAREERNNSLAQCYGPPPKRISIVEMQAQIDRMRRELDMVIGTEGKQHIPYQAIERNQDITTRKIGTLS
ncbi:MAG: hypothetical protein GY696_02360, partial [Gammaproteobacteria bacterium]|nr:hypothetical protein [Gammaproteobacteria bacterium]